MNILEILKARSLVQDISDEALINNLPKGTSFYVGFDPTAPSLQIGNLVPLLSAIHLGQAGYKPIILFGGSTGAIGDPSGKNEERKLLEREVLDQNVLTQKKQVSELFGKFGIEFSFVNNLDWTKEVSLLDFLRDVGKYLTVSYMLGKEVVKTRLETTGISYAEFSYMLLQAFDFLHLYQNMNCKLQVGGSDQWGNITAGLELIRKKIQGEACALSFPLVTDSAGKKFGKSESGAIWLDANMTSPYQLHQYLLNVNDSDVIKLLKIFTFLDLNEIHELEKQTQSKPEERLAQKRLADSLCEMIHGSDSVKVAKESAQVLFGGSIEGISDEQLAIIFKDVPSSTLAIDDQSLNIADFLHLSQAVPSKAEAKRLIKGGGAYVNNQRIEDPNLTVGALNIATRKICIVRTGKKSYRLVELS